MSTENETSIADTEVEPRGSRDYWTKWIKAAKKAAECHFDEADAAWAEFEQQSGTQDVDTPRSKTSNYPIYWSSVKTLKPAYYSRTPKLVAKRRFTSEDPTALTSCLIKERLAAYLIDQTDFDGAMDHAVSDFIHADKATTQIVYTHDMAEERVRAALMPSPGPDGTMGYLTEEGEPYLEEVMEDEGGAFYESISQYPINQKIDVVPICFDEILHTPEAKTEYEIKDKAYFFCMTQEEARARFSKEVCDRVQWKVNKTYGNEKEVDMDKAIPGKYLEGWEIYCKITKRVYWWSEQYPDDLLDSKDDPYGFKGFFPSPKFIIGSKPAKSLYPTPAFRHMEQIVKELHEGARKKFKLIKAIRRRALVDGSFPELLIALEDLSDNEFVSVKNLQALLEKGGDISKMIYYIPVQELVQAIQELTALEEQFKNQFYEWFGIPDILRGATDPLETAAAQEIKSTSAHDRFKYQKKQVAQLATDSIEMMCDLALQVFDDAKIMQVVGFDMLPPDDQMRFPQALEVLRSDEERSIRIEVDSDSMSFLDRQLRYQQTGTAVNAVMQGLQGIAQMSQTSLEFASAGLQTLLASLDAMELGGQFEDTVKAAAQKLFEKIQNPPEQQPPPDYEMMKIQTNTQLENQAQQLQAQQQAIDAQMKARELQGQEYKLQLDAQKQTNDTALAQMKLSLDQTVQQFMMALEAQRVQIEQFKAQVQAAESGMEEARLAREADLQMFREQLSAAQEQTKEQTPPQIINVQAPSMPPMNIAVEASKPGNKIVSVIRDELGNAQGYQVTDVPQNPLGL